MSGNKAWLMAPSERTVIWVPFECDERNHWKQVKTGEPYERPVLCGCWNPVGYSMNGTMNQMLFPAFDNPCSHQPDISFRRWMREELTGSITYLCWSCALKMAGPDYWYIRILQTLAEKGGEIPPVVEW